MAQQINLLTPILLLPKRYFSALAMAKALALVTLGALGLAGYLDYQATVARRADRALQTQMASERQQLQTALASLPAAIAAPALQQQFDSGQQKLEGQRRMWATLKGGLAQDGQRHSDMLQLLAVTVPPAVWLTELRWQAGQLELDGATLDTGALRAWLDRLAAQPLLQGLQLSAIKIERQRDSAVAAPNRWNFTLRSQGPSAGTASGIATSDDSPGRLP